MDQLLLRREGLSAMRNQPPSPSRGTTGPTKSTLEAPVSSPSLQDGGVGGITSMAHGTQNELLWVRLSPSARLPERAYEDAIGYDIYADITTEAGMPSSSILPPRSSKRIRSGFAIIVPAGFFATVCSRSGLSLRVDPIFVANAPGIVDPDYTGDVSIILYNGGHSTQYIRHHEAVGQIVLLPRPPELLAREVGPDALPATLRGDKGFGSTG